MSQLDLIAELRAHRPVAPAELRERVRDLAAAAPAPAPAVHLAPRARRRRRRSPALAAVAGVLGTRDGNRPSRRETLADRADAPSTAPRRAPRDGPRPSTRHRRAEAQPQPRRGAERSPRCRRRARTSAQRYSATLSLRLKDSAAVSAATNKALRIVAALGGHPTTVNVDAARKDGEAYLVLKVPRTRVQEAVQRLGALGTIVGENVSIQDLPGRHRHDRPHDRPPAGASSPRCARSRRPRTCSRRSTRSDGAASRSSSAQRAATIRAAYFATVKLRMETPPRSAAPRPSTSDGPLHGLGVAFRWIGIGAVYALALGAPLVCCSALALARSRAASAAGARKRCSPRLSALAGPARRRGTSASRPAARRTPG